MRHPALLKFNYTNDVPLSACVFYTILPGRVALVINVDGGGAPRSPGKKPRAQRF